MSGMRFAYADPPYLGCGEKLYGFPEWDTPERHQRLIEFLQDTYPDGWAMSLHTPSIRQIAPMLPADIRCWQTKNILIYAIVILFIKDSDYVECLATWHL